MIKPELKLEHIWTHQIGSKKFSEMQLFLLSIISSVVKQLFKYWCFTVSNVGFNTFKYVKVSYRSIY